MIIVFDLDDTVYSSSSIEPESYIELFDVIFRSLRTADVDIDLEEFKRNLLKLPLDQVFRKYHFEKKLLYQIKNEIENLKFDFKIEPYSDFFKVKDLDFIKILVTSGMTKIQKAKILALKIENIFDDVIVDDPFFLEDEVGKKDVFMRIVDYYNIDAKQVVVIGDNPSSELVAGLELGMTTVHFKPHKDGVECRFCDYCVSNFSDFVDLVHELGRSHSAV